MSSRKISIEVDPKAEGLEIFAADQLHSYLAKLFGAKARVTSATGEKADARFVVGLTNRNHVKRAGAGGLTLSDQGHVLRRVRGDTMLLTGGSPQAVCWAVFELAEHYGVRHLVHGDVFPEEAGRFHLPDLDAVLEPLQRTRTMCLTRDHPIGSQFWSLADHRALMTQLFKLKFNAAQLAYAPSTPKVALEVEGIPRTTASMNYAQDMPINADNIGREHLGRARSVMPPEFEGAVTFDELHAVLKRFIHGLIDHAKSLGMRVSMSLNPLEFPVEFRPLLQNPTTKAIQLGDLTCCEQGDLLNPNHMALVKAVFEAHLTEYGEVDELGYGLPEHAYAQSRFGDSWERLQRRFGLTDVDVDALLTVTRESGLTAGGPQRAEREFKSFVTALDFYDRLFAETELLAQMADHGVRPATGLNMNGAHQALAFAHRALPEDVRFSVSDYTASRLVRKLRWLERLDPTGIDPLVMASLQDDNIGWLPQVATESLHILLQTTHRLGWDGFQLQHWAIGDIDPPLACLSRMSWQAGATPGAVYADHFGQLYGQQTIEPLCQAMRLLEDATSIMAIPLGMFFPVLGIMRKHVRAESLLDDAAQQIRSAYEEVRRILVQVGDDGVLKHGEPHLAYWASRMTFSIEAIREIDLLRRGGAAACEASLAREYYERAVRAGEAAVTAAASHIRDPSDRGGVVAYYHLLVREVRGFIEEYLAESRQ